MGTQQAHAVVVSAPGLGLLQGCVLLGKALLSAGVPRVTLACFAQSYHTTNAHARINLAHPSLRLEILADGLPPDPLSYHHLFCITPTMRHALLHLLHRLSSQQQPATCLISDTLMAWTQDVADQVGIPRVDYWTGSATSYLCVLNIPDLISHGYACSHLGRVPSSWKSGKSPVFLDCLRGLPRFPLDEVPKEFRYAESDQDPLVQMFIKAVHHVKDAQCVLIHSAYDLESEAFESFTQLGIKAYPVGPLLHLHDDASSATDATKASLTWLDSQATSSVVYVSFGSNSTLTADEVTELALGLEASGHAFLWVLRSDGIANGRNVADVLPRGFEERIGDRGLIMPWMSQVAVLAHRAVGGFLSHCGWNSTLESLWMGVPILACPQRADQPMNARLIVKKWAVGIELETSHEGMFSKHHVEGGIRTLFAGTSGQLARTNAKQLSHSLRKASFEGGDSHSNLLQFASKMGHSH